MISSYCGNLQGLELPVRAIQQGHGPGCGAVEGAGVDEPGRPAQDIEGLVGVAGKQVIGTLRLEASEAHPGEALLAFGPNAPPGFAEVEWLSRSGDLAEAAANLFAMLRRLDRPPLTGIAVMPIPERGLGRAINDRLRRAAAPR